MFVNWQYKLQLIITKVLATKKYTFFVVQRRTATRVNRLQNNT